MRGFSRQLIESDSGVRILQFPIPDVRIYQQFTAVITPEVALKILEASKFRNRPVNDTHVAKLSRAMKAGLFRVNGMSVIFSKNGNALDGQHRLYACVDSGVPFTTAIVTGIDEAEFESMGDQLQRSAGDNFSHHGIANYNVAAAISAMAWYWEQGKLAFWCNSKATPSKGEIWAAYLRHRSGIDEGASKSGSLKPYIGNALGGFCWFTFGLKDAKRRDLFFERIVNGTGLTVGMSEYALRRRMESEHAARAKIKPRDRLILIIKAWKYRDRITRIIKFLDGESFPEIG